MTAPAYVLGHAQSELRRLSYQDRFYRPVTLDLLRRAGIGAGMRVLDIGCGAGDVSRLTAELVGPSGTVVGLDRSPDAISRAMADAPVGGPLSFLVGDVDTIDGLGPFDAVVGRFVLMYLADPVASLTRLRSFLAPGGVAAFVEMDLTAARCEPAVPAIEALFRCARETFAHAGIPTTLGPQLWRLFRDAGLAGAESSVSWHMEAAPAANATVLMAETLRSLLPMMERYGITDPMLASPESLAPRIQEALVAHDASLLLPAAVGAWARAAH